MNLSDIIKTVSLNNGVTQKCADAIIKSAFDLIETTVNSGEKVYIAGFGTFDLRHRPERQGRNPNTSEAITIAASDTIRFKASKKAAK